MYIQNTLYFSCIGQTDTLYQGALVAPVAHEGLSRIVRVAPRAVYIVRIVMNRVFAEKPVKNDVLQMLHVAIISRHVLNE